MSRHFGKWDAEPEELEQDELAEMHHELAEIAERDRAEPNYYELQGEMK